MKCNHYTNQILRIVYPFVNKFVNDTVAYKFTNQIKRLVYPFVNKFVNDMVAYKFFYDVEEIEVGKQNTLKNATDVCARYQINSFHFSL